MASSSEARQLLGDLVVASAELCARPLPEPQQSVIRAFDDWFAFAASWLRLVIDCGIAVRTSPADASPDLIAALAEPFAACNMLGELRERVRLRFTYAGTTEGDLWINWEKTSIIRSALEVMRDLLDGDVELADQLDTSEIESAMASWGKLWAKSLPVPDGMPPHHWWWFANRPPGRGTLRRNSTMKELYSRFADVPAKFRRFVEAGFVTVDDCVFFRRLVPPSVSSDDLIAIECDVNALHLEDYLDVITDERALVDAAHALTFWLASELRRRSAPPCRIITSVNTEALTSVLRFHVIRPAAEQWIHDVEGHDAEALLVLDTVDPV